jgi:diaminopimelate epimerase
VRFEKWQALGNDYAIVEERELPFELTPGRVRAICAPHTGIGSDGILLLSETGERGFVAEVRIYNPDGSEAELSGNGVRQAVMYLRRNGWADQDSFSVRTAAGEVRPRISGPTTCTVEMGRARLRSERDFPAGGEDGVGMLTAEGREFRFQFVQVGNPQCSIEVEEELEELDVARYGAAIERHELFPRRTNVSFWRRTGASEIRVRIFERGAHRPGGRAAGRR